MDISALQFHGLSQFKQERHQLDIFRQANPLDMKFFQQILETWQPDLKTAYFIASLEQFLKK